MADESMDIDHYDPDAIQGGGGYVDDDIDLDDDDDDEPIVTSSNITQQQRQNHHRTNFSTIPLHSNSKKRSIKTDPHLQDLKRRKKNQPRNNDYRLRASGMGKDVRDFVVAKFVSRMPTLEKDSYVRLFRNSEPTIRTRKEGVERHAKQQRYYNSFSGKRYMERKEKEGAIIVPDRYQKDWTMHVMDRDKYEDKKRRDEIKSKLESTTVPPAQISTQQDQQQQQQQQQQHDPDLDVFSGTFDGKSESRYAIMVLNEGTKTVDVVPIDPYAWFTFRANRGHGDADQVEAKINKAIKKGEQRLAKFQVKMEVAQGAREMSLGDNTRLKQRDDFASVGIMRNKTSRREVEVKEEMDFDQEFDNDDVAQVDKEEQAPKREPRRIVDTEKHMRDFRNLIKDVQAEQANSDSDSDGGASPGKGSKQNSRSPSPSRPPLPNQSPSRNPKTEKQSKSRHASPGATPSAATPLVSSPSPSRSPSRSTPRVMDLAHLLPPPGVLPTREHLIAVLTQLLKGGKRIPFKDLFKVLKTKTKEEKKNMRGLLKQVAAVTADPPGSKQFYIFWKDGHPPRN